MTPRRSDVNTGELTYMITCKGFKLNRIQFFSVMLIYNHKEYSMFDGRDIMPLNQYNMDCKPGKYINKYFLVLLNKQALEELT